MGIENVGYDGGDVGHLLFFHSTGSDCWGTNAQTAGLERASGFAGYGVAVEREVGFFQRVLGDFAGELWMRRAEVHQQEMVVGATADEAQAAVGQSNGKSFGVVDDFGR